MQKSTIPDTFPIEVDIPSDWHIDYLCNSLEVVPTGVTKYEDEKEYFSTGSIQDNAIVPENKYNFINKPSRANRMSRLGDVFQARMQFTDKCLLINKVLVDKLFSTGFIQVRPKSDNYNPDLLYFYLRSPMFLKQRDEYATGSTQVALTDTGLKKIIIPIPPRGIQDDLVKKVFYFVNELKNTENKLGIAKNRIQKFRRSVITSGITGKLTEKWRDENQFSSGKSDNNSNLLDIYDIPEQWQSKSIQDISVSISTGPFGSSLHKSDYISNSIPIINPQHIVQDKIVPSPDTTVSKETKQRLSSYILHEGNIIIARRGEMGRCAVVTSNEEGWLCGTGCFFIELSGQILSDYFQIVFSSDYSIRLLSDNSVGTTMSNLNRDIIKRHPIPLPSIDEQREILRLIKQLLLNANAIELQIEKSRALLNKLTQSILAKAFRGELIV